MKLSFVRLSFSLTCVVIASAASPCSASLISNGSFETGDFTGWAVTGSGGIVEDGTMLETAFFGGASDGNYSVQMNRLNEDPDFTMEQTVATQSGVRYSLTFDFGRYDPFDGPNSWESEILVEVIGNGTLFSDSAVDTRQDLGGTFDPLQQSEFLTFATSFVANSASTTLRFTDQSTGTVNADTLVDNFKLKAIPEPSTIAVWSLLGLMGGAATLWQKRRKKS